MATIAVLNQKGGVGKTTLATNLAAAAHLSGDRTLLIDLDQQGSTLDWYHAREEGSQLDGLAAVKVDRALAVPKFKTISKGYSTILIDGPPRLGLLTRSAAVAADLVVIPVRPGAYDLWALEETVTTLDEADAIREELGKRKVARVFVVNQAATNTRVAKEAPDALKQLGQLAPVQVGLRIAFAEAANVGESVLTTVPNSPAASETWDLYRYLKKREGREQTRRKRKSRN